MTRIASGAADPSASCREATRTRPCPSPRSPLSCADLRYSAIGLAVVTVLVAVWIAVFQTQWQKWGATGLNLLVWQPPTTWWLA